jgi:N-acylneuraminate cytidylyltransferase
MEDCQLGKLLHSKNSHIRYKNKKMSNNKQNPNIIALIPARSGSKRIPDKNIKSLNGHPLIAYSIISALDSKIFDRVIVSTDSTHIAKISEHYGAEVPFIRPAVISTDTSPDIDFVEHALNYLNTNKKSYDCFSILRPTSPFRKSYTIKRAWNQFKNEIGIDSLRAVEKCQQHPCKMWVVRENRMLPLIPFGPEEQPWHSSQYPTLPEIYVQNASLEIAWSKVVYSGRTISGHTIIPFLTEKDEGIDVNTPTDWVLAKQMITDNQAILPEIKVKPYIQ